jgi:hypothetical protein
MATVRRVNAATHFLNVDVEVVSRSPLNELVAALGQRVLVHYVGPIPGGHAAYFSLSSAHGRSADSVAHALATLISGLAPPERRLWRLARSRTFDVGIQGGLTPFSHPLALSPRTIAQLSRLKARVVFSVYGARVKLVHTGKRRAALGAA